MKALRGRTFRPLMSLLLPVAVATAVVVAGSPPEASASVSIAVTLDDLTQRADAVAVIVPIEASSVWEDGKIITYTKVRVDESVAGALGTSDEVVVRTLGGVVGDIGQQVDGEPVFLVGQPSLLFLRRSRNGTSFDVAARAQGQYPVLVSEANGTKLRRVIRSTNRGVLLPPRAKVNESKVAGESRVTIPKARLAGEALHDRALDDVTREIATAWRRLHAPAAVTPRTTP